jgi:hypothetical protein
MTVQITSLSTMKSLTRRNDRQDQQIEELQRRLWQIVPTRSP